jgi:uncharacterized protein (DUF2249 family)
MADMNEPTPWKKGYIWSRAQLERIRFVERLQIVDDREGARLMRVYTKDGPRVYFEEWAERGSEMWRLQYVEGES